MTRFAVVFPGQGSQSVGMLDPWADHPVVRRTLDEASTALGEDLAALVREGPKEELDLTANTQPAMLAAGVACWRALHAETGLRPDAFAGHSLGEYSALVAAGALSLADALPLVRFRAQVMQDAVAAGAGAMAAVLGLDADDVVAGCAEAAAEIGEPVSAANFNDPNQTVIAGTVGAVERAGVILKARGAKRVVALAVSAPFHCALMKPAADRLRERLAGIALMSPQVTVVNNVDVAAPDQPAAIADALYRQAYLPVRWVEVVRDLRRRGITHVVECGPGRVLTGLTRRIDEDLVALAVFDPESLAEAKAALP